MTSPIIVAQFGRYSLQAKLASLGACTLWRVEPILFGKERRSSLLYQLNPEFVQQQRVVEEFVQAGRRAQRLRHPNITVTEEVLAVGNHVGIVTEPTGGTTVRDLARQVRACHNSIPIWFAVEVARRACAALTYAHGLRGTSGDPDPVRHQALDSTRVVITESGRVKVAEFGIGEFLARRTSPRQAPPLARGRSPGAVKGPKPLVESPDSDIAELAGILFELLTLNERPWQTGNPPTGPGSFQPPSHYVPTVPRQLDSILFRACLRGGVNCFNQIGQLGDALDTFMTDAQQRVRDEHLSAFVRVIGISAGGNPSAPDARSRATSNRLILLPSPKQPRSGASADEVTAKHVFEGPASQTHSTQFRPVSPHESATTTEPNLHSELGPVDAEARTGAHDPTSPAKPDWLAALEAMPRETLDGDDRQGTTPATDVAMALDAFEEGLERQRAGDLLGAEITWQRALQYDPELRAAATNLKLLQKRRRERRK